MKMFKRFAAALLAGVMVLARLTACGGGAGGSSSNEIESKVLELLNTTSGTSFSNNAELQSKVRKALAKTNADGVIEAEDVPCEPVGENQYMQCVSDFKKDGNTVSFVMYLFDPNNTGDLLKPVTELKDVKPMEVTEESKKKLDDMLENAKRDPSAGNSSALKAVGVATYTASNGKTYIGIAMKCEGQFAGSNS